MFFLEKFLAHLKQRSDCDFVDRVHYYYTPILLAFFALTLSAKQYAGQPIQCWVPAQFTGAWEQYSEYYCFVQNTYFVPFTEDIPEAHTERSDREIGYYQWVPFILALQAFFFFIPIMVWRIFNWQSGIWVKGIINAAVDVNSLDQEKRGKSAEMVARHIEYSVQVQKDRQPGRIQKVSPYGKHYGSYISILYLVVKGLFIVNIIGQIFILNRFLGPKYTFWGVDILRDIINGREWEESGHFPRVTMCDFKVRVLGNLHNWSIQCVLMINMFNEKIYLFLWWWFLLVAILTIINFFYWIVVSSSRRVRRNFVSRYLEICERMSIEGSFDEEDKKGFLIRRMRPDVAFLLRLISSNVGDVVTTDIVEALWKSYKEDMEKKPPLAPRRSLPNLPPAPSETGVKNRVGTPDEKNGLYEPDQGFIEHNPF